MPFSLHITSCFLHVKGCHLSISLQSDALRCFASHEALLLPYEEGLTRLHDGKVRFLKLRLSSACSSMCLP